MITARTTSRVTTTTTRATTEMNRYQVERWKHWHDAWEQQVEARERDVWGYRPDTTTKVGRAWDFGTTEGGRGYLIEFEDGSGMVSEPGHRPLLGRWAHDHLHTGRLVYSRTGRATVAEQAS